MKKKVIAIILAIPISVGIVCTISGVMENNYSLMMIGLIPLLIIYIPVVLILIMPAIKEYLDGIYEKKKKNVENNSQFIILKERGLIEEVAITKTMSRKIIRAQIYNLLIYILACFFMFIICFALIYFLWNIFIQNADFQHVHAARSVLYSILFIFISSTIVFFGEVTLIGRGLLNIKIIKRKFYRCFVGKVEVFIEDKTKYKKNLYKNFWCFSYLIGITQKNIETNQNVVFLVVGDYSYVIKSSFLDSSTKKL